MRKLVLYLATALWMVAGCSDEQSNSHVNINSDELKEFKSKLVGVWRAESAGGTPVTGSCLKMRIEYKFDGTFESFSGENITYQDYEVSRKENRWVIKWKITSSNNKPNCQGYTMKYMLDNAVSDLVIDIVNDRMFWFSSTKETVPFAIFSKYEKRSSYQNKAV